MSIKDLKYRHVTASEIEANELIRGTRLEKRPDHVIKDQYEKIQRLWGDIETVPMFHTSGAKNYFARIKQEHSNR